MIRLFASALLPFFLGACSTIGYYGQAVKGQFEIFQKQRPIETVLTDPDSPKKLKERLRLVGEIRDFAGSRLALPGAKTHYGRYADLGRPHVVWNVFAAPEFSLDPKSWWYLIVGRLEYRGFFSKEAALELSEDLKAEGLDTAVGGVSAYSTLGFFRDPVLNTFINDPEVSLAGLLFHELTHHRFFLKNDTTFSEGLATAVEEEGLSLWVEQQGSAKLRREFEIYLRRRRDFVSLIDQTRDALKQLYASVENPTEQQQVELRKSKAAIFADLKSRYQNVKASRWDGYKGYDKWFNRKINNAHLNSVAAYFDYVPGFKKLIREADHDFDAFFETVERIAKLPEEERKSMLGGG